VANTATSDPALDALFLPFDSGQLRLGAGTPVAFLRAQVGPALLRHAGPGWRCQQSFRPWADALQACGLDTTAGRPDGAFRSVLVLPPRQRQEARATLAHAVALAGRDGQVIAAAPNQQGARTAAADLEQLAGPLQSLSKHHCRVFWTQAGATIDDALLHEWQQLDSPQPILDGRYLSRPGLFAWDRIDAGSALLAAQLPDRLSGRVADLGGGYGFLSCDLLRRCAGLRALDLYEAEARALEPARLNLQQANAARAEPAAIDAIWHDVTAGLPHRYDAIVSNPPFHATGRADRPELGQAFIDVAADALQPDGELWLVANRHLPYEATLSARFAHVDAVAADAGFKVYRARGPARPGSHAQGTIR